MLDLVVVFDFDFVIAIFLFFFLNPRALLAILISNFLFGPDFKMSIRSFDPVDKVTSQLINYVQRYAFAFSAQANKSTLGIASKSLQSRNSFPAFGLMKTFP